MLEAHDESIRVKTTRVQVEKVVNLWKGKLSMCQAVLVFCQDYVVVKYKRLVTACVVGRR